MTQARIEAERIVDMFKPYVTIYGDTSDVNPLWQEKSERENAIQCAIKHVDGILEEYEPDYNEPKNLVMYKEGKYRYWNGILTELKQM